jgi:hypothetical protein
LSIITKGACILSAIRLGKEVFMAGARRIIEAKEKRMKYLKFIGGWHGQKGVPRKM